MAFSCIQICQSLTKIKMACDTASPYISLLFDQPYSEMPYSIFYYIETSHSRFYFTKTRYTRSSCLGCMCVYVYMHVHIRDQPLIIAWPPSTLFSDKRCHSQRWSLTSVLWLVASEPKTSVSTPLAFKLQACKCMQHASCIQVFLCEL